VKEKKQQNSNATVIYATQMESKQWMKVWELYRRIT